MQDLLRCVRGIYFVGALVALTGGCGDDAGSEPTPSGQGGGGGSGLGSDGGSISTGGTGAGGDGGSSSTGGVGGGGAPSSPQYPNLPDGMTLIGSNDGSVKEAGGSAFGIDDFGGWSSSAVNLEVVPDPTNPTGSGFALRGGWGIGGHDGPGIATADTFTGGPYSELYLMVRVYFEEGGWDFGHKFFYVGAAVGERNNVGSPTQFYADRPSGGFPQRIRLVNQNGGTNVPVDSSDPPPEGSSSEPLVAGQWLNLELHFVAESPLGAGNGQMAMWVNDVLAGRNTNVSWVSGFDGMQWYGNTNTSSESYYRIGELYIAGK